MSSLTFESVPDEILMIIFLYSGDVSTVLRTYLGLNRRLNGILLDNRLHLLTDFLSIHPHNDYFNSQIFQQVSQQLSSINTAIDEENLDRILQPLISFHIRQRYIQMGQEFQSSLSKFQSIRQQLTDDERSKIDHEIKTQFNKLNHTRTIDNIKCVISLVSRRGARLVCSHYGYGDFNLAKAIPLVFQIDYFGHQTSLFIHSYLHLFKALIVSNPSLLENPHYMVNGACKLENYLIYNLACLRFLYGANLQASTNIHCYRVIVDLFLFILQCHKSMSVTSDYIQRNTFEILELISETNKNLYVRTTQFEVVKILVDQYDETACDPLCYYLKESFKRISKHLVKNRRFDILIYLLSQSKFHDILHEPDHIREILNTITRDQVGRRLFSTILDHETLDVLFDKKHLIFILIDKKERTLLKQVLMLFPHLIDELDEDGNDLLLYLCLRVNGCRHRIIEMLINMGSNLERKNFQGQNFIETLKLTRNKQLYQKLIEHEII